MGEITSEEKTWGMLSHLSFFIGGFIVPLILYFVYKDKSRFIAFHALQALFFHLAIYVALFISGVLTIVLIGLLLLPAVYIVGLVYAILGAIKANSGEWYELPLVSGWAKSTMNM